MDNIDISIITVTKNSEKTVERTIQSVLYQTKVIKEYIIIDGLSTDKTMDIVRSYENKFQQKGIKYIYRTEKDNGIYQAMNKGLALAQGQIVGIINSDDWYEKNAIEIIKKSFKNYNNYGDVWYGIVRIWKNNKELCIRKNHHNFLEEEVIQHPTCFIKKKIYETYGYYNESLKVVGDYELLNRFKKNGIRFIGINKIITNFSYGGITVKSSFKAAIEKNKVKKKYNIINKRKYFYNLIKIIVKYKFLKLIERFI